MIKLVKLAHFVGYSPTKEKVIFNLVLFFNIGKITFNSNTS